MRVFFMRALNIFTLTSSARGISVRLSHSDWGLILLPVQMY